MGRLNKRGAWAWVACLSIVGSVQAELLDDSASVTPTEAAPAPAAISEGSITQTIEDGSYASTCTTCMQTPKTGFLRSDHAFDDMILPISNPVFAIDPRSSTHARLLFINNWTPGTHLVIPDDSFQAYAGQINLALTERLSFIAQKMGTPSSIGALSETASSTSPLASSTLSSADRRINSSCQPA